MSSKELPERLGDDRGDHQGCGGGFQDPYGKCADLYRCQVRLVASARIRRDQGPQSPQPQPPTDAARRLALVDLPGAGAPPPETARPFVACYDPSHVRVPPLGRSQFAALTSASGGRASSRNGHASRLALFPVRGQCGRRVNAGRLSLVGGLVADPLPGCGGG